MEAKETEESELIDEHKVLLPWVSLPKQSKNTMVADNGLIYLKYVSKFYIFKNIQIFDKLFDSPKMTQNCLTVRNRFFQQIYYIGTDGNRKPGKILPFTLRVIDQYNSFVIRIKKYLKPCFSEQIIDIECPPGQLLAKMARSKHKNDENLFLIYASDGSTIRYIITQNEEKKNKNEFKILSETKEPIASISKRYEKVLAIDKTVIYEDHYVKVKIEEERNSLSVSDKAIILSVTLIVVSILFVPHLH